MVDWFWPLHRKQKKLFGIRNVDRWPDLPKDPRLMVVPPRMNLYIKKNLAINQIFSQFTTKEDIYPYSIDESILDMTHSWKLFGKTPQAAAHQIQVTVKKRIRFIHNCWNWRKPTTSQVSS